MGLLVAGWDPTWTHSVVVHTPDAPRARPVVPRVVRKPRSVYRLDLLGVRFHRLVVIERVGADHRGHVLWRVRCDCGNETIAQASSLRTGGTRSCGCMNRERASHATRARNLARAAERRAGA